VPLDHVTFGSTPPLDSNAETPLRICLVRAFVPEQLLSYLHEANAENDPGDSCPWGATWNLCCAEFLRERIMPFVTTGGLLR
jgi:hypothetical protein